MSKAGRWVDRGLRVWDVLRGLFGGPPKRPIPPAVEVESLPPPGFPPGERLDEETTRRLRALRQRKRHQR